MFNIQTTCIYICIYKHPHFHFTLPVLLPTSSIFLSFKLFLFFEGDFVSLSLDILESIHSAYILISLSQSFITNRLSHKCLHLLFYSNVFLFVSLFYFFILSFIIFIVIISNIREVILSDSSLEKSLQRKERRKKKILAKWYVPSYKPIERVP